MYLCVATAPIPVVCMTSYTVDEVFAESNDYKKIVSFSLSQVVNCSTPANYYHVLRRQLQHNFRKPVS